MAAALDVAEAILTRKGDIDSYQLHKLLYFAQAVHLARHHGPLFEDRIEAWPHGPVVRAVFRVHRRQYRLTTVGGDPSRLADEDLATIDELLELYGRHSSEWLQAQTHIDRPWADARAGLAPDEASHEEITAAAMLRFYNRVLNDPEVEEALAAADTEVGLTSAGIRARYGS